MARDSRPPDRIRVRRFPTKGRYGRATIEGILDRGIVAHLAFVDRDEPVCIPTLYARVGGKLYIHGSRASRMMRLLAAGQPACLTVTLMQGLVLARSTFEHTANYESVVAFGCFEPVEDADELNAALESFTNKLIPGRFVEVRPPSAQELRATTILAMPIEQASAKVRQGPPDDDDSADALIDVWAGEIPIVTAFGEPVASPGLRASIPISASVSALLSVSARKWDRGE